MRVITFSDEEFAEHCHRLREAVENSGYCPDCVVAIASGGVYVAKSMAYDRYGVIELSRPGTNLKRMIVDGIVRRLPRFCTDRLRIMESKLSSCMNRDKRIIPVTLPDKIATMISGGKRILVVDDAVDSGVTMARVVAALKYCAPEAEVQTAVITVTQRNPLIMPDFYIYNNSTLIRFPWSGDSF